MTHRRNTRQPPILNPPPAPPDQEYRQIVKVAFASLIGTSIEWYDYFLYGTAAALVFNKLFFPSYDPLVGTLLAFATFSLGFIARPVGGIVFGHFGDKIGRKKMLYLTLMIMGLSTACIGLLPTYAAIGIWAPILLVGMRLLQGFGLGGEWGGAVLMAVEHAPANRRGFYGSWPQLGAFVGLLLSTLVFRAVSKMPDADFLTWGWRVPFLLSFILVAVGIWIRMTIAESPVFQKMKEQKQEAKMPIIEALTKHPKNIFIAMGARFAENGLFYVFTVFSLTYISTYLKVPRVIGLNGLLWAACLGIFTCRRLGRPVRQLGPAPGLHVRRHRLRRPGLPLLLDAGHQGSHDHRPGHRHPGHPRPLGHVWPAGQLPVRDVLGPGALQRRLLRLPAGLHLRRRPLPAGRHLAAGLGVKAGKGPTYIAFYMILLVLITVVAVAFAKETNKDNIGA